MSCIDAEERNVVTFVCMAALHIQSLLFMKTASKYKMYNIYLMSDVSAGMYNACLMLPASLSLLLHFLHLLHIFTFSTFTQYFYIYYIFLHFLHIYGFHISLSYDTHKTFCFTVFCHNQIPRTVVVWRNLLKGLLIRENNKLR